MLTKAKNNSTIKLLRRLYLFIFSFVFPFLVLLALPPSIFATNLQWNLVYESTDESTEIRFSGQNTNKVFGSIRKHNPSGYDILKSFDGGLNWSSVKNNLPVGQDVNWIAIKHSNDDVVAISLWGSGIYLTEDGGDSWTKVYDAPYPRATGIDPISTNRIFAGISDRTPGLYRTINKGSSWTSSNLGNANSVDIITDPNNQNRIFASVGNTMYRSLDAGNSWSPLPLNGGFASGLIDKLISSRIYITTDNGFFKSTDGGDSWSKKTVTTGSQFIFRVAQDQNGYLYTSVRGSPWSVWRSKDFGETWENVGDPAWGQRNTWGLDAAGQRVIVSVEGLGIYYADTNPVQPNPVVLIPGFGASWSYKGLIENQTTTYDDWKLMPVFTDVIYQPLISTLSNAGSVPLIFAYDFRKSIADSAASLNTYLSDKAPGQKANIVGHSMGGLVARYCFEKISGCADKIDKIVTAGSPHQGTLKSYPLWEAGDFGSIDLPTRTAVEIALHAGGFPYLTDKDIIQNKFPGVRDLLPLGSQPGNPVLQSLSWTTDNVLTTFGGKDFQTNSSFTPAASRTALETALGLWADGKPASYTTADGDGIVLTASSQLGSNKKYYSLKHNDYFKNAGSLTDLLTIFSLTPGAITTAAASPTSILSFIIHSPATIQVKDQNGNAAGTNIDGKAVFISNPAAQNYQVILAGTGTGNFQLDSFFVDGTQNIKRTTNGTISSGATINLAYAFSPNPNQTFSQGGGTITLASFRAKAAQINLRSLKTIEAAIVSAFNDILANRNRTAAFSRLEKAYIDLWRLLGTESNPTNRRNLRELSEQLTFIMNSLNSQYRTNPSASSATAEISRAQASITKKQAKTSLLNREALNFLLSQQELAAANQLLSAGANYEAILFSRAANILAN